MLVESNSIGAQPLLIRLSFFLSSVHLFKYTVLALTFMLVAAALYRIQ